MILQPLSGIGMQWAQNMVREYHYLRRPVDPRCSVEGYTILIANQPMGCLLFGRPEATRCQNWYGGVDDLLARRCECSRWEILNLARVWLHPSLQPGGEYYRPYILPGHLLPGYIDRKGVWRSTLISTAILQALDSIVVDYLLCRPPCFLEEPYELRYCLSYCNNKLHKGTVYRAAGFELFTTNRQGIQTWRKRLRPLTTEEREQVIQASERSVRSQTYRAAREPSRQLRLPGMEQI